MKKILILAVCICLGSRIFAQSFVDLSLGFQYGTARVTDDGETLRKITEPGVVATFRLIPGGIGFFGRAGLLFPSKVTEGEITLTHNNYDYILFINGGLGASVKVPLSDRFFLVIDVGMSINDLLYGGSYKENITSSWEAKLGNLGQTYKVTATFRDVKMRETYNDVAIGILGNVAGRFNFTKNLYLELGVAASFDFLRFKSYSFSADFSGSPDKSSAQSVFPAQLWDGDRVVFEEDMDFSIFKQFTFIPSISIGFSF